MSVCIRYTRHEQEAIEVMNTGFYKIFKSLNTYDANRPIEPWITTIMVNSALTYVKQKKNKSRQSIEEITDEPHVEMTVDSDMDYEEMIKVIQTLSLGYRTVFNMYVIDGYKHEEIAEKLNISVGASKSNLSRAKKKLQEIFNNRKNTQYA